MTSYNGQHHQPTLRNGLINGAVNNHKRRNSDEVPDYASQYIPTLPTFAPDPNGSSSNARYHPSNNDEPLWEPYYTHFKTSTQQHIFALLTPIRHFHPRSLLSLRLLLTLLWLYTLHWGESQTFTAHIHRCSWPTWESWPPHARPHHLVLIADPQLVDPHTYPGRPWPLSSLTMGYTDRYMRRGFEEIVAVGGLGEVDSVVFLGDLFDGGREWGNDPVSGEGGGEGVPGGEELVSAEREWRRYGQGYWMGEWGRFGRVFFDTWVRNSRRPVREGQRGRRFIASLPGNHDLGLGGGIRLPVRQRFEAFFGEGNRVDVIGNHSFVSLDTVSLSAKDQVDVEAGTQGYRHDERNKAIWEPTDQFLHEVNARKARAIDRELRVQNGRSERDPLDSTVYEITDPRAHTIEQQPYADTDIPSIVLTHVPLYRAQGTPCGPLREKYPPAQKPTSDGEYIEKDDPNSISVAAGKQYQNVLTPALSNEIIDQVQDVSHVFSGDDHDYCEVVHREYTSRGGGVREITVKSTSWAMGVRHPGFLLVSLWNPIDAKGKAVDPALASKGTIQTHLCLLPDQLTTFIRYGMLLVATLVGLLVRAVRIVRSENTAARRETHSNNEYTTSYLPTTRSEPPNPQPHPPRSSSIRPRSNTATHSSSNSSSTSEQQNQNGNGGGLNVRSAASSRPRSISPGGGYGYGYGYGLPQAEVGKQQNIPMERVMRGGGGEEGWNDVDLDTGRKGRRNGQGVVRAVWDEWLGSVRLVGGVVGVWYFWLLWTN